MNASHFTLGILAGLVGASQAGAQDMSSWQWVPKLSSAGLAALAARGGAEQTQLLSSSALSWPDGRQAVVTFWRAPHPAETEEAIIYRCIDYFDEAMRQTGGGCYIPARDAPSLPDDQ